jgi:hypothetical protein
MNETPLPTLREIFQRRREAAKVEGPLAKAFRETMLIWDVQKADGVSLVDRLAGLTRVLQDAWPRDREWKYLCANCSDYGLVLHDCAGDATCGRSKPHLPHGFGEPCWCSLGARFRAKPKPTAEDFTAAGKSKPTRVGR